MAIRTTVLYETGGNLRIMSAAQLDEIRALAAWFYQEDPVETLSVVASNGNLSPVMTDRRYQAGTAVFNGATAYASEAATPDISAIDTTYDKVSKTRVTSVTNVEPVENGSNTAFPIYWDGATKTIKSMTKDDFFDTFIGYTITNGLVGTGSVNKLAAGTYTVLTNSTSIAGNPGTAIVSTTPIFVDTRADATAYTAAGIEETQDQPETINSYYLHKIQQTSKPTYQMPLFLRSDGSGVQVYTTATFEAMVEDYTISAAFGKTGYSITHEMGSSVSNQKGTNINDTYLSGTSADGYTQYLASVDDYRTQEFPNGTAAILNSYKLGVTTSATYTATASVSSVNEGGSVTFTITTNNVAPGNVSYTITGISSGDLSSGSLSGTITTTGSNASASGTTSVTLSADGVTEGTETMIFTAGGSSVSVTINDTSTNTVEIVSLEGTPSSPEVPAGATPLTDGTLTIGWRFYSNGDIADYYGDRAPTDVTTGHIDWVNTSPSKTYYIRATLGSFQNIPVGTSGGSMPGSNGTGSAAWYQLTGVGGSNQLWGWRDDRSSGAYGTAYATLNVSISESPTGADQVTSNQYSGTSPETYWREEQTDFDQYRITVYWDGEQVWNQGGYNSSSIPTSVTTSNGYQYAPGTGGGGGDSSVTRTIPGILASGNYRMIWEGGA